MITLYSNGCPNCKFLEKALTDKGIAFTKETDIEIMKSMGFTKMPMLDMHGEMMEFGEAVKYVMKRKDD